jgi:hypothetical protein
LEEVEMKRTAAVVAAMCGFALMAACTGGSSTSVTPTPGPETSQTNSPADWLCLPCGYTGAKSSPAYRCASEANPKGDWVSYGEDMLLPSGRIEYGWINLTTMKTLTEAELAQYGLEADSSSVSFPEPAPRPLCLITEGGGRVTCLASQWPKGADWFLGADGWNRFKEDLSFELEFSPAEMSEMLATATVIYYGELGRDPRFADQP